MCCSFNHDCFDLNVYITRLDFESELATLLANQHREASTLVQTLSRLASQLSRRDILISIPPLISGNGHFVRYHFLNNRHNTARLLTPTRNNSNHVPRTWSSFNHLCRACDSITDCGQPFSFHILLLLLDLSCALPEPSRFSSPVLRRHFDNVFAFIIGYHRQSNYF